MILTENGTCYKFQCRQGVNSKSLTLNKQTVFLLASMRPKHIFILSFFFCFFFAQRKHFCHRSLYRKSFFMCTCSFVCMCVCGFKYVQQLSIFALLSISIRISKWLNLVEPNKKQIFRLYDLFLQQLDYANGIISNAMSLTSGNSIVTKNQSTSPDGSFVISFFRSR